MSFWRGTFSPRDGIAEGGRISFGIEVGEGAKVATTLLAPTLSHQLVSAPCALLLACKAISRSLLPYALTHMYSDPGSSYVGRSG